MGHGFLKIWKYLFSFLNHFQIWLNQNSLSGIYSEIIQNSDYNVKLFAQHNVEI